MSSSKNRSPFFYSPLKVEADQKDVIIARLKEEVYHLKKNEQQFYVLEDQYRGLDHKYCLLSEEKVLCDADFKGRHDTALRDICHLKNEIDSLRAEFREKQLEVDDLLTDESTLKNQLDQRLIEIEKLRSDFNSLLADNDELLNERARLEQIAAGLRGEIQALLANVKNLNFDTESVRRKIDDMEKYLSQLKTEETLLKDKIISYENENNGLDGDITATIEDINILEGKCFDAQNELSNLNKGLAEVSAFNDKNKSEALHFQRSTQAEQMKNNDLAKQIAQAENILRVRINQVEEGHKEIAGLRAENDNLDTINSQLDDDFEFSRKHLENIGLLNSELVAHLQAFSEDDEFVRSLINRRDRVTRAKIRVQEVTQLVTRTTSINTSSGRKSKLNY